MSSITKICKIQSCDEEMDGLGYCKSHRYRFIKYGDATVIKMSLERHGLYYTYLKEHETWSGMKKRCHNPRSIGYSNYGARGIEVCDRWLHSFKNFLDDMGARPSKYHSIERIDVNGNYEPSNCRWATSAEQANNKRTSHYITIRGKTKTIRQWCREYGIPSTTFHNRLNRGWTEEKLISNDRYKI